MPTHWTRLLSLPWLLFVLFVPPASAANEWWIARSSGEVWILEEGRPSRPAMAGTVFPNASTLATGPNGRALLTHGAESVVVGPGTTLALAQRGGTTRIVQVSGSAEFEVERQNVQHFSVETRYFAAVVKGTHFTVTVEDDGARVGVARGVVEVTAPESGQRTDLTAGMEAMVTADNPAIGIFGGRPTVQQVAPPRIATISPPAIADETASTILAAAVGGEDEEEADEDGEDEEDDVSSGPDIVDDSGGPPRGEEQPGPSEDHDSGHGNDDDHDDGDNSGHGHDHDDSECDEDEDS